jgi:glycosyltransferase involved in cell wall biosynthesis
MSAQPHARPVVVTLVGHYLPGHLAGGPIRSVANLTAAFGDELDFRIITRDRDLGVAAPYDGVPVGTWTTVGKAQVLYLPSSPALPYHLSTVLRQTPCDLLYLNSYFDPLFAIWPLCLRRLGLLQATSVLLAPRGQFSPGALALKPLRKRAFISLARLLRLHADNGVLWHASSRLEAEDIARALAPGRVALAAPISRPAATINRTHRIAEALDLVATTSPEPPPSTCGKEAGVLRAVFLSRVSPKKNLDGALRLLRCVKGRVEFSVYGPIEDAAYWRRCEALAAALPANVRFRYGGQVPADRVSDVFAAHHLLLFPTHGENFGHVIAEALIAGCPVLLSDQTPWRQLQAHGVGWDLPLADEKAFIDAIESCIPLDATGFAELARRARAFGLSRALDGNVLEQNRAMFRRGLRLAHDGAGAGTQVRGHA